MCTLISLTTAGNCIVTDGGIRKTYITDLDNVTNITYDVDGQITALTMSGIGLWESYEFDDDDSAYYNQNGAKDNKKFTNTQEAFFKFAGITVDSVKFANGIKDCCALIAIHFLNSGKALVQGVQYINGSWSRTKKRCVAAPSILTDTGDNEERLEVRLTSEAQDFSAMTSLDEAAIDAL